MTAFSRWRIPAVALAVLAAAALIAFLALGSRGGADASGGGRPRPGSAAPAGERTRVEVLNAAGRAGIAREATRRLRERGFDVVYYGNAEAFGRDSSVVLDRVGDIAAAKHVAAALGIDRVRSAPDPELLLEVTVVLGLDWPPRTPAAPSGVRGRIRRLWRGLTGGAN